MLVVLTGANGFGLQAALDRLVGDFVAEHGDIAVERLSGDDASYGRLQASLQSSPFLAARKLVLLRSAGLNKKFAENIEQIVGSLPETTDVIMVEPKIDKRSSYYKFLKKHAGLQEFNELDEPGLTRWLVDVAKGQGGQLGPAEARFLVERVGLSQQVLASELEKLIVYSPQITKRSIELLVEATPQSKIFDLLEAAFAGNARRALELYRDQRAQKVDPSQIIAMLAWQLKVLALVIAAGDRSAADIVREAKISPYVVQKSSGIAKRLGRGRLRQLVGDLLTIDARSKRENIDLDEALQNYLLSLA